MPHFRLPALPLKLLASFATLICMGAASALWTLHQFSPSILLSVAVGQKFSPSAEYFFTVRWWVWLQLGAMAITAAALACWLHASHTAPLRAAVAAAKRMAGADFGGRVDSSDAIQNNELLSTMQEMNTCISEIIVKARQHNDCIAGGASELARSTLQGMTRSVDLAASLKAATGAGEHLTGAARRGADSALQLGAQASAAAEAAQRGADLAAGAGQMLTAAGAGARRIADLHGALDELARQGETLALSLALEAARTGADSVALLAGEVRALAGRTGAAAQALHQQAQETRQAIADGAEGCALAGHWARGAGAHAGRAGGLAATLTADSAAQQAAARELGQALAAAEQARRRAAALTEQAAAGAAAVRDQAGALVRTLGSVRLGPEYGTSPLIRLAHSTPARLLAPAAARAKRTGAAHLISIS